MQEKKNILFHIPQFKHVYLTTDFQAFFVKRKKIILIYPGIYNLQLITCFHIRIRLFYERVFNIFSEIYIFLLL